MRKRWIALTLCAVLLCGASLKASAAAELTDRDGSYVFSYWGETQATPRAYETERTLSLAGEGEISPVLTDLASDAAGRMYIADSAGSCIWVIASDLTAEGRITAYTDGGEERTLSGCEGVWADDGRLYIANTGGKNVVVLDAETHETLTVIHAPSAEEWSSTVDFEPVRLSTDGGGRVYRLCCRCQGFVLRTCLFYILAEITRILRVQFPDQKLHVMSFRAIRRRALCSLPRRAPSSGTSEPWRSRRRPGTSSSARWAPRR